MAAVAYIALATLVLLDLGSMELGMSMPVTASALFLLLIEVVAFGTSVIAIILMRRRTSTGERRYRSANAALLLFAAWFAAFLTGTLRDASAILYYANRADLLDSLVHTAVGIPELQSMSDGLRSAKTVNGMFYDRAGADSETGWPLELVLETARVTREQYDAVRRLMIEANVINLHRSPDRVQLVIEGIFEHEIGLMDVRRGRPVMVGDRTADGTIHASTNVGDGWWIYSSQFGSR